MQVFKIANSLYNEFNNSCTVSAKKGEAGRDSLANPSHVQDEALNCCIRQKREAVRAVY